MKAQLATSFTLAATMLVATSASADKLPDPVTIDITSPTDGQMFEGSPAIMDVTVAVTGEDMVETVDLFVDDASVAQVAAAPWSFTGVELAEGMHTLYAVANSIDGIGYPSPTITVAVVAGGETGGSTGTDTGTSSETGSGTGTDDGPVSTPSVGSYCSTTGTDNGGLLGFGLLALAALGRTRRRA